jgi:hypothetical protein
MSNEEEIVSAYLNNDITYDEAVELLIYNCRLTAMEAEKILDEVTPE